MQAPVPFVMGMPTGFMCFKEAQDSLLTSIVVDIDEDKAWPCPAVVPHSTVIVRLCEYLSVSTCVCWGTGCAVAASAPLLQVEVPPRVELPGSIVADCIPSIPEPLVSRLLDHMMAFIPPKGSTLLQPVSEGAPRVLPAGDTRRPFTVVEEWPLQIRAACLEVNLPLSLCPFPGYHVHTGAHDKRCDAVIHCRCGGRHTARPVCIRLCVHCLVVRCGRGFDFAVVTSNATAAAACQQPCAVSSCTAGDECANDRLPRLPDGQPRDGLVSGAV